MVQKLIQGLVALLYFFGLTPLSTTGNANLERAIASIKLSLLPPLTVSNLSCSYLFMNPSLKSISFLIPSPHSKYQRL